MAKIVRYYLNQKQPFTGVYSRLQKNTFLLVSLSIKLQTYSLKKGFTRDVFLWVCLIFQNTCFDILSLTEKLNLKCYVLYETKEILTITKTYITIINSLIFIFSIAIVTIIIIIIIIIIITITVITISIIILFIKSTWRIC